MTRYLLTILRAEFERMAAELAAHGRRVLCLRAGLRRGVDELELILPGGAAGADVPVRLFLAPPGLERVSHLYWATFPIPTGPPLSAELALHPEWGLSAALYVDGRVQPISEVRLAGPRCERWQPAVAPPELQGEVPSTGPFSRYAGALGGGAVHRRLANLSIGILGGRAPAVELALGLARSGVGRLVWIDELCEPDLELLTRVAPGLEGIGLRARFTSREAWRRAAACDVLIAVEPGAVDPVARMARAYHRALLQVAAGGRVDLAFALPGDLPHGLAQPAGELPASLGSIAAAQAQHLLESYVAGGLSRSTGVRLELGRSGRLYTSALPDTDLVVSCPCSAGLADTAFPELHGTLPRD
jgi:hypothetical protein